MAKKKHKTTVVTPPKQDSNVIVIQLPLQVATGHPLHWPRAATMQHKNQKRHNTRQTQLHHALRDW